MISEQVAHSEPLPSDTSLKASAGGAAVRCQHGHIMRGKLDSAAGADPADQIWLTVMHDADEANEHLEHADRLHAIFSKRERAQAEHEADKAEIAMLSGLYWLYENGRLFGEMEELVQQERVVRVKTGLAMLSNGDIPGFDHKKLRIEIRAVRAELVKLVLARATEALS